MLSRKKEHSTKWATVLRKNVKSKKISGRDPFLEATLFRGRMSEVERKQKFDVILLLLATEN